MGDFDDRQEPAVGSKTAAADDDTPFGGPAPPAELLKWSGAQLQKLCGNPDTTLVHFLMSLKTEDEVKQYIIEYLGDTPKVRKFAAEFYDRRYHAEFKAGARKGASGGAPKIVKAPEQPDAAAASAGGGGKKKKKGKS